MVAAYKKYCLVSLLKFGKEISLPKYSSHIVERALKVSMYHYSMYILLFKNIFSVTKTVFPPEISSTCSCRVKILYRLYICNSCTLWNVSAIHLVVYCIAGIFREVKIRLP